MCCRWVKDRTSGWLNKLREQLLAHPEAGLGEVRPLLRCQHDLDTCQSLLCRCGCRDCQRMHPYAALFTLQCGLDHAKAGTAGHEEQAEVFSQQLHLGSQLRRPVSVRTPHFKI